VTLKTGLGVVQAFKVIENGTIRKLWYGFLFAFHSNYGSISSHFGDKAEMLVENRNFFSYLLPFDDPVSGIPVGILPYRLVQKN